MDRTSFVIGTLTGLVVVLCVTLLIGPDSLRRAEAQATSGSAGAATIVTASYDGEQSVCYVLNAEKQTILIYSFNPPEAGSKNNLQNGQFEFLAGRHIKFDELLVQKLGDYQFKGVKRMDTPTVDKVKEMYSKVMSSSR